MLSDALMSLLRGLSLDLYLIFICGETLAEGFDCLALALKLLLDLLQFFNLRALVFNFLLVATLLLLELICSHMELIKQLFQYFPGCSFSCKSLKVSNWVEAILPYNDIICVIE